ncbi:uncharacterized protein PG998_014216 [Apiospora kogelbergensis]|uniref:uncharacterized protein n=1 Tax=Apiospora kogelbergensis TaxID=1337665 RepID=UPI00312E37FF
MAGAHGSGKQQSKMCLPTRSNIACLRCRGSKINCENNGGRSHCDSYIKAGKEYTVTPPETKPTPTKWSGPSVDIKQDRDGNSDRKKPRRVDDISQMDN